MGKSVLLAGIFLLALSFESKGQVWKEKYLQAQDAYAQDKYDQAFALGDESLRSYLSENGAIGETYAAILRLLSTISYSQQKLQQGIAFIDKELLVRADKRDTTFAVALTNKALFEEQLGESEKAIKTLLECQTILTQYYKTDDLTLLECNLKIATNYYFLKELDKAKEWFVPSLSAIEKKGDYTAGVLEAYYYAGLLYFEMNDNPNALATFSKTKELYVSAALTETLSYPMVLYGLARIDNKNGDFVRAEETFKEGQAVYEKVAGKEGENYCAILGGRIVNLFSMDQQSKAEEFLRDLQSRPEGKDVYASTASAIAGLYHGREDFAKAETYYGEALKNYTRTTGKSNLEYAETNLNFATLLADRGGVIDALKRMEESRSMIEKQRGKQNALYLSVLIKIGTVQTQAGNLGAAREAFSEAAQLVGKLPTKPEHEIANMSSGLAAMELRNGNYARADSLYQVVIVPYQQLLKKEDRYYSQALNNLAAVRQFQGRFVEALDMIKKSASTTRKVSGISSLAYGVALDNMALLRLRVGDLANSKSELDSALMIYEKTVGRESMEYASGMMSMGRYYQVTGDYTLAEPFLKDARLLIKKQKGEQSAEYAGVINGLAILYQTLGNYRDAEGLLKEARSIIEKVHGKTNEEYATAIQNLATLYQLQGSFDLAEPLLKEALEIDRLTLGVNHPQYAITQQNLATLYQKLGRMADAQVMLEQVLQSSGRQFGKYHPSYITTLSNLAALYQDQGNFPLAETTWKQSVELRKKVLGEDHPDYARSLYGLAGVYHAQHQWAKAKENYEPVVEKYQKQVVEFFPALSEKEKSAFYAKIKPVFDAYQDFCFQYLHANPTESSRTLEKLYNLQLGTKAILLNATSKVRARILASGDAELQELFKTWLVAKEEIVRFYNSSQDERSKFNVDLPSLELKANDLEKKLSSKSDAFRSQFEKESVTWKNVQDALLDGEAAVEILRIKKKYAKDSIYYVGMMVNKSSASPELISWKLGSQLEGRKFKYHRNTIKHHLNDTISYSFYWEPLAAKLAKGSTVFLSCDGVFNKVNFNSLFDRSTHRFVIEDYRIRQLTNTRELIGRNSAAQAKSNSASLYGFADFNLGAVDVHVATKGNLARALGFDEGAIPALPATEKEVDEIQKLLKANVWSAQSYKRAEATEENMKSSDNPKVIHIATHGFFLGDLELEDDETSELASNPLFRSGVLLAGAGVDREASQRKEDGILTAYEAMNLNLDNTELVVLSACETGLGEVRNGEGVYGLQRSFLVAGANNVLMSLWQVDDVATQELMNAFYALWIKGTGKHEAFRDAQLQMKGKYQIPYFWGAFVLIGN